MTKSKGLRIAGFLGTAGLTVALAGAAVSATGAYFTDSESGTITGTMGTIQINASGGGGLEGLDINFTKMLPGEAQSHTINYTNTGANPQDVWVVFDKAALGDGNSHTDTGLINDRGRYGEIHIASFGTERFGSANLNDDATTCPFGSSAPGYPPCNPLPAQVLLASNLNPGQSGDMAFSYTAGALYKSNQGVAEVHLPYKIVATQHGIAPDNSNNAPITFP